MWCGFALGLLGIGLCGAESHRQIEVLQPSRNQRELRLHTFVVDRDGNLVTGVSSSANGPAERGVQDGWIQVYAPDKSLLREIALPFAPTALAITPDGKSYLAGGDGQLWLGSTEGKVIAETNLYTLLGVSPAKLREAVIAEQVASQKEYAEDRGRMVQPMKDQLTRLLEKPEAERTSRDKARIESVQQMIASIEEDHAAPSEEEVRRLLSSRLRIPSVSAVADGVLVTLRNNRRYEIWRCGGKFENPRRIVGDLSGCCGQMDMTTQGGYLFTAENTKFQVGIYDLDGKQVRRFGERHTEENQGFGSCCNPMNVTCCANGDLITAESSIGHLKRFSPDGTLLGVIGRARIGGGCKHVAIGVDEKRDRYYVQYEDRNHICILVPKDEAAPFLAKQDKAQKEAIAALDGLVGRWELVETGPKPIGNGDFIFDGPSPITSFILNGDRSLKVVRADDSQDDDSFRRCHPIEIHAGWIHVEIEEADGYVECTALIKAVDANQLEMVIDGQKVTYRRQS